jgi:hypothetical protein
VSDKITPLPEEPEPLAGELSAEETRCIENLAVTDPINTPEYARKERERESFVLA